MGVEEERYGQDPATSMLKYILMQTRMNPFQDLQFPFHFQSMSVSSVRL